MTTSTSLSTGRSETRLMIRERELREREENTHKLYVNYIVEYIYI